MCVSLELKLPESAVPWLGSWNSQPRLNAGMPWHVRPYMDFQNWIRLVLLLVPSMASAQDLRDWSQCEAERCHIYFASAVRDDALRVRDYMDAAAESLITHFDRFKVDAFLRDMDCNVYVHQTPTNDASVAKATIRSGVNGGRYSADIHFLAQSSHPPEARTAAGEPKDEEYMRKLVNHEYSSVVLDRLTRMKSGGGWRFHSGPIWFVQGYEEYLGIINSSNHNRTVVFARYREIVRSDPSRVGLAASITVRDSYVDGAMLLAFLHDRFDRNRIQNILTNPAATFDEAFKAELGTTMSGLAENWREWLAKE